MQFLLLSNLSKKKIMQFLLLSTTTAHCLVELFLKNNN